MCAVVVSINTRAANGGCCRFFLRVTAHSPHVTVKYYDILLVSPGAAPSTSGSSFLAAFEDLAVEAMECGERFVHKWGGCNFWALTASALEAPLQSSGLERAESFLQKWGGFDFLSQSKEGGRATATTTPGVLLTPTLYTPPTSKAKSLKAQGRSVRDTGPSNRELWRNDREGRVHQNKKKGGKNRAFYVKTYSGAEASAAPKKSFTSCAFGGCCRFCFFRLRCLLRKCIYASRLIGLCNYL